MNINTAKEALEINGFKCVINETDGLTELDASKDGFSEQFYDSNLKDHCSTYLCEFDNTDLLVNYADKSINLQQNKKSYKEMYEEAAIETEGYYKGYDQGNALSLYVFDKYNVNAADNNSAFDALIDALELLS